MSTETKFIPCTFPASRSWSWTCHPWSKRNKRESDAYSLQLCCIQVMELDLSSLASVRRFGEAWAARGLPLHALINNAGIFSMSGEQGCCEWKFVFQVNSPCRVSEAMRKVFLPGISSTLCHRSEAAGG